ncbi:hypothetical protein ACMG4J_02515 [Rossellomorea marisflavi]|uniref:hypothetical protein n=1 Tax=Rossellomorea marisflavi TaxID=189381 RepID=UPI0039BEF704
MKLGFGEVQKENLGLIQSPRSIYQVLGTLAKFPQLLLNPRMDLSEDDFVHPLHKTTFVAIKDIVCKDHSIKKLTHKDIDDFLSEFDELYGVWNQYNGLHYLEKAIEHSNANTFKIHYQEIKKYWLMRKFANAEVDVNKVYNYLKTDLKLLSKNKDQFESLSVEDLERQLMKIGKGNTVFQKQLLDKETEIDSQIALLMKRKQELNILRKKLA